MRRVQIVLALLALFPTPALACRDEPELAPGWLRLADLVIVAQVSNYRVVSGSYEVNGKVKSAFDFARIDVRVDEVLLGTAPANLEVTWDTGWFALPKTFREGSYLIALHAPGKHFTSPARAKSWTVISPICERSFLIPSSSREAVAIRAKLQSKSDGPAVFRETGEEPSQ